MSLLASILLIDRFLVFQGISKHCSKAGPGCRYLFSMLVFGICYYSLRHFKHCFEAWLTIVTSSMLLATMTHAINTAGSKHETESTPTGPVSICYVVRFMQ